MKQTNQNKTQQKNSYFNNTNTTQDQFISQFLRTLQQQNQPQQSRQGFDDNISDWDSGRRQQQSQQGFDNNMSDWNQRQQQQSAQGFDNNMSDWNPRQQQQGFDNNMNNWNPRQQQQGFDNNMNNWNSRQQQQQSQQGFDNNVNDWNQRQQQQLSQQGFGNNMSNWNSQQQQQQQPQGNSNWGGWFTGQQQLSSNNGSGNGMGMMGVGMGMGYPSQWSSGSSRSMSLNNQKRRRNRSRSPPLPPTPKPPRISKPTTTKGKPSAAPSKPYYKGKPQPTTKGKPQPALKVKQQLTIKGKPQPTTKGKPQPTATSKPTTTAAAAGKEAGVRRNRTRNRGGRRTLEFQPELGKPGGLDDPLRKGLSGCGVRWYMRYLMEGFPKEIAREKAEQHRTKPTASKFTGRIKEEILAKAEKILKQNEENKANKIVPVDKIVPVVTPPSIVSISLMAKEYPEVELTEDQLAELEEAIVEEMATQRQIKLQFEGIRVEAGCLVLDCANKPTARWLKKCVTKMNPWKGVELRACLQDELERPHTIFVKLPKSAGQETTKSLLLIGTVNVGLSTENWDVVNCEDEDENQLLTIKIDKPSYLIIKQNENLLRYRFGKVEVKELENELSTSSTAKDITTDTDTTAQPPAPNL